MSLRFISVLLVFLLAGCATTSKETVAVTQVTPETVPEPIPSSTATVDDHLFIPATSPFESVNISYDRAIYPFLSWNTDSIILYFILTLIAGFLFKPMIGVNI